MSQAVCATAPVPAKGWTLELIAEAPKIRHPSVVCVAPDGRVFVAEDPMDISTKHANEQAGRILCLHRDGRVTVFADHLYAVFGMQYLRGSLFVLHNPKFSRFRDEDGMGRDREELIEQTNPEPWALDWNDHVPSNFRLAMDGYFYVAVGDKGLYGAVDRSGRRVDLHGGGVVRIRPDGTGLEVFARGVRNILDVAMDAEDELFTYDNTDENQWMGRVTHMVDGGFYGYPFDFIPRRPYTLWMFADYGPGAACGAVAYTDDALPAEYRGNLFLADFGQRNLRRVILAREAGTFRAVRDELLFPDPPPDFRPVGIHETEDGRGFYICDWQHLDNKQEVTVGRLWKLSAVFATNGVGVPDWYVAAAMGKPVQASVPSLLEALAHPRKMVRQTAQHLLSQQGPSVAGALLGLITNGLARPDSRWHALWALHAIDPSILAAEKELLTLAENADPAMARQVMRELGERGAKAAVPVLVRRLNDPDPSLRFWAATALGRIADPSSLPGLLQALHRADAGLWPHFAAWTAVHRIGRAHPQAWAEAVRALDTPDPDARERISFALRDTYDAALVGELIRLETDSSVAIAARLTALSLLQAMHRQPPPWRGEWWSYHPFRLEPPAHTEDWPATAQIGAALREALRDPDERVRLAAVAAAGELRDPAVVPLLRDLTASSDQARQAILLARAHAGDADLAPELIRLLPDAKATEDLRRTAIDSSGLLLGTAAKTNHELSRAVLELLEPSRASAALQLAALAVVSKAGLTNAEPVLLRLSRSGTAGTGEAAVRVLASFGLGVNLRTLSELATNAPLETRREAIVALGDLHEKKVLSLLLAAAQQEETREAAWRALAAMPAVAALDAYLAALNRPEVVIRDRARRAIKEISADALPELEKRTAELTPLIRVELRRVYEMQPDVLRRPFLAVSTLDARAPEDYARHAMGHVGDPWNGQRIFFDEQRAACIRCHAVHGWGGAVGPEMTTAGAQFGRAALVESILYPSKAVREGYQQVELELKSGESISGILKAENAGGIVVLDADARQRTVSRDDIVSRRNSALSLMPEGLQAAMTLDEFSDLVAYLESLKADPRRAAPPTVPAGWRSLVDPAGPAGWHAGAASPPAPSAGAVGADWLWADGTWQQQSAGSPLWTAAEFGDVSWTCDWRWRDAPKAVEQPVLGPDGEPERGEAGAVLRERILDCGEGGLLLRGSREAWIQFSGQSAGSGGLPRLREAAIGEARRQFTPLRRADRPLGQWNHLEVVLRGHQLTVTLNGTPVLEGVSVPGLPPRGSWGFLAGSGRIEFRNLFVLEVGP